MMQSLQFLYAAIFLFVWNYSQLTMRSNSSNQRLLKHAQTHTEKNTVLHVQNRLVSTHLAGRLSIFCGWELNPLYTNTLTHTHTLRSGGGDCPTPWRQTIIFGSGVSQLKGLATDQVPELIFIFILSSNLNRSDSSNSSAPLRSLSEVLLCFVLQKIILEFY